MLAGRLLVVVAYLSLCTTGAFVDNGILGDPYVNCGSDRIDVRFDTRNTFKGIVFVEDHLGDPECRSAATDDSSFAARNASLSLGFKDCGIDRRASSDPKGIFMTTTVIVAFNPEYLTKIDRVYVIQCYYMEMESMLEKQLTVTMQPPPMQTQQVPMPVCRYEVLDGSPEGAPVFYATIGQMVYHKWTCEAQTENQFCMLVHSCTVDDGHGDHVELIDNQGCAQDKFLLQNLDYVSDLMVGKEAHVYKYADRQSMFFDCQITLTIKEPGQEFCDVPKCPDPPRRRRFQDSLEEGNASLAVAVREQKPPQAETTELEASFILTPEKAQNSWFNDHFAVSKEDICMSSMGFGTVAFINVVVMSASVMLYWNAFRMVRSC